MLKRAAYIIVTGILLGAMLQPIAVAIGHPVSASENQQPIQITSVLGPLQPVNPGGPTVEITLKNVTVEPIISLTATLELSRSFDFAFDVTPSHPLQPNSSTSSTLTLIGGAFGDNVSYPLTIAATLQSGAEFVYTELIQIAEPPLNSRVLPGLAIAGLVAAGLVTFFLLRRRRQGRT